MRQGYLSLLAGAVLVWPFAGPAQAEGEKIAVFTKNLINPFFQTIRLGSEAAARQTGTTVTQFVPTKPDNIAEQITQVEDVIARRPDAVVFIPVDFKAMVPSIKKMNEAKIPVVNINDRAEGGDTVTFVGSNDFDLAQATAKVLLDSIGGKGNVVILEGVRGSLVASERLRGFKKALEAYPNVKLLASQTGNYQRLQGLQVMENFLQSFPQIDGVLAASDTMALGAVEALEGAKRPAKVVGMNGTKEAIDAVKSGRLLASGDYNAFWQGCVGTMAAVRTLRHEPVPKEIIFPANVIVTSNVSEYDVAPETRSCPAWNDVVN